jgi:uncharacterized protein (TIGR02569 family)
VLKPLDTDPDTVVWLGDLLGRLRGRTDFRVSEPLRTTDGGWTAGGWTAWRYQPGAHAAGRWRDVIDVGRRLHAALEGEREPAFLARRTDRWALADRVAWGELPASDYAGTPHIDALVGALRPVTLRRQLVHGDLTGNVLFDERLPPLVIDLSPYWRPPAFASAVVVADALVFEGAGEELLEPLLADPAGSGARPEAFAQCLLRALVFRAVTDHLAHPPALRHDEAHRYRTATRIAVRLAASTTSSGSPGG